MKKTRVLGSVTLLFLVCGFVAGPALADDEWSFGADVTANSKYVWRGINLVDAPVLQPSVTVGYGGWSFNVWGNMETHNANTYGRHGKASYDFTEVDLTLDYSWSWDDFSFSVGIIQYIFPNTGFTATTELYAGVGYDCFLSPSITVYQDIDEAHGTYVSFGVSHAFEEVWKPTEGTSMGIELSAAIGWGSTDHNRFYYGTGDSGFADLTASVAFPFDLGGGWSLTPAVNCSTFLDKSIQNSQSPDTNIWYGLTLGYSF